MRRTVLLSALAVTLSACTSALVNVAPAPPIGYVTTRTGEGTGCGVNLFGIIPIAVNSRTERAYAQALEQLFFTVDLGYDYDFDQSELRRFAWDVVAWIPGKRFSFDLGVGGSQYDTSIRWTPSVAQGSSSLGDFTITAQEDNQLGTTFVDFLGGAKVRLTEQLVASGAVTVPLTSDGFRPAALGTIALEFYF